MSTKEKSKNKKTSPWLIVLICVLAFSIYILPIAGVIIATYIEDKPKHFEVKDNIVEISKGKLVIEKQDSFYDEEDDLYYITGYLKNTTKKDYSGVSLTYRLYDNNGYILGEASSYIDFLAKEKTWKFKVTYGDIDAKEVGSFELTQVDYY